MPEKEEPTPTPEPATTSEATEFSADKIPAELQDPTPETEPAAEPKPDAEPAAEPADKDKLTVTAEPEVSTEAEKAAPAKEPTVAEQIESVREVFEERDKRRKTEFDAQLVTQQQQMEQRYAPLMEAARTQEQERVQSEAVQGFRKALGADFEDRTGLSPQTAQAIGEAAIQHLLPADPYMRDSRAANDKVIHQETWGKFNTSMANQVEAALGTPNVSTESLQKGMDFYNELVRTAPKTSLFDAAKKVAEVVVNAERSNGKTSASTIEATPTPTVKASVTSAAPPGKETLTEEEEQLYALDKLLKAEDVRERGFGTYNNTT